MQVTRRIFTSGLAIGLAAPAVLRGARRPGRHDQDRQVVPITGPAAEAGKYAMAGAKLALEEVNKAGGVLGKQLEIVTEDDQTTNPGAVLAFSKLAANADISAFIGSIRSTQVHAMAPDVLKNAKPMMFGGTDPKLTKLGNPWLFRFRPNDSYSGRVIADFGVNELEAEEVGHRAFHRRVRHRRRQGAGRGARKAGVKPAIDPGLQPTSPRTSRPSCWR